MSNQPVSRRWAELGRRKFALLIATFAMVLPGYAQVRGARLVYASLGGDTVSILADQGQMEGTRKMTAASSYTLHEIHAASGTVVREYQSAEGTVFGIAWHGPVTPDLRQILGSHYAQYEEAMKARSGLRRGRRPILIDLPELNVQISGHPGSFSGRAYVPGKLPQGMRAEDIQ